tara:strand:+ start:208 stop:456 length:249 start_codon:yes stop_codon:yes gene_type:complete
MYRAEKLEDRDHYFTYLKGLVQTYYEMNRAPVVLLGHRFVQKAMSETRLTVAHAKTLLSAAWGTDASSIFSAGRREIWELGG